MLSDTIPELLYNGAGQEISNLFFTFGEQELTIFEKSQDEITAENIASMYTPIVKKVRTIDFYYDGNLELTDVPPLSLRTGIGTKEFPFTRKDFDHSSTVVNKFLDCLCKALQQSCPDIMLRIFCRGVLEVIKTSAIICPWPDENSVIVISNDMSLTDDHVLYIVDADVEFGTFSNTSAATGESGYTDVYVIGCRVTSQISDTANMYIHMQGWSFFNSSVNFNQHAVVSMGGEFFIGSTFTYSYVSGRFNFEYRFFKDCNLESKGTSVGSYDPEVRYACNSNFTMDEMYSSGDLWVDCQVDVKNASFRMRNAVSCTFTIHQKQSGGLLSDLYANRYIDCIANIHIVGEISYDTYIFAFAGDCIRCTANFVIDCTVLESEFSVVGFHVSSESASCIDSTVICDTKINLASTFGREEYSQVIGFSFYAANSPQNIDRISGLTCNYLSSITYTPPSSMDDILGSATFYHNYAKIAYDNGLADATYIEPDCKWYKYTNYENDPWPIIGDTCI